MGMVAIGVFRRYQERCSIVQVTMKQLQQSSPGEKGSMYRQRWLG